MICHASILLIISPEKIWPRQMGFLSTLLQLLEHVVVVFQTVLPTLFHVDNLLRQVYQHLRSDLSSRITYYGDYLSLSKEY